MAEEKKTLVLFNDGPGTHHLKPLRIPDGKDKDGNDKVKVLPRVLGPRSSIEALDKEEFDQMLQYKHIKDASKMVPVQAQRVEDLQAQIKAKDAEIADLRAQLADKDEKVGKGKK